MSIHKHPERYHKKFYNKRYFEGWYYKLVTADLKHTISFIPGVNFADARSNSFIQCIHLKTDAGGQQDLDTYVLNYPLDDFSINNKPFEVVINKNKFDLNGVDLAIDDGKLKVNGSIKFSNVTPIKTSFLHPNIMGVFSYIPFMECNHGVLSMGHDLLGKLNINGQIIDFTGGKGYLEKDWGISFPKSYIWIQSNHFDDPTVSFFSSVARIPFGPFSFRGLICNLQIGSEEYRFATYNGSKLKLLNQSDNSCHYLIKHKSYMLEVKGEVKLSKSLLAPKLGDMSHTIKEGLSGQVTVRLRNSMGKILFEGNSNQCGIEIVSDLKALD